MNNIITPVEIINFEGNSSAVALYPTLGLSGYTLPITPFTFVANFETSTLPGVINFDYILTDAEQILITELTQAEAPGLKLITEPIVTQYVSNKRVVWDFGDGTFGTDLTAKHYYKTPGIYKVTSYFFNNTGGVYKNTVIPTITCYNFIQDTFNVTISSEFLTSGQYILTAGRIENPFLITTKSSWQNVTDPETNTTVYGLRLLSGTQDYFLQKLDTNKYGHLYPYSSFYDVDYDNNFVEVNEAIIETTPIYCTLSSSKVVITTKDAVSSVFCGVSGSKVVYVKDDRPGNREITVFKKSFDYNNTLPIIFDCSFLADEITKLAISSNGITGEGKVNNTFDIDSVKYVGQKINFIVTLKDKNNFTIKSNINLANSINDAYPNISLYSLNEQGVSDPTLGTFTTNFSYLSTLTAGFFRGTFTPSVTANNISIGVITNFGDGTFITLDDFGFYISLDDSNTMITLDDSTTPTVTLSTRSSTFTVYPSTGNNRIAKINEDFDFSGTLKDLRYQEFLLDKTVLFDDFLGTAFGVASSEPTSPGKLAYEKIADFTSNNVDVYRSNLQGLLSMNNMVGGRLDVNNTTNFGTPSELKRLVDIFSINHSRIWGSKNSYNENFNNALGIDAETLGVNLGSQLDFFTTVLTSGYDDYIVAYEKFSKTYTKCSTFVSLMSTPVISVINSTLSTYALSSYNPTWGWPVMIQEGLSAERIPVYYEFYNYIPTPQNSLYNNVINFNDPYTTLSYNSSSYNDWVKRGGIIEEMLDYVLYTGVGVLSS